MNNAKYNKNATMKTLDLLEDPNSLDSLYQYYKKEGVFKTQKDFCDHIGITTKTLNNNISGRNPVSKKTKKKINEKFPNYEEIILPTNEYMPTIVQEEEALYNNKVKIPFYDTTIRINNGLRDWKKILKEMPTLTVDTPEFQGCNLTLRYECENMACPDNTGISKGATVGLIHIDRKTDIIQYGLQYLIVSEKFIFIYTLYKEDDGSYIGKSFNEKFPPTHIREDQIKELYLVKGWLNRKIN